MQQESSFHVVVSCLAPHLVPDMESLEDQLETPQVEDTEKQEKSPGFRVEGLSGRRPAEGPLGLA